VATAREAGGSGRQNLETSSIPHVSSHLHELLAQNNEDVKVVQELLRHANSRITLDLYAQAGMAEKREAQRKVVAMVLKQGTAIA
jgi:integrase